MQPWRIRCEATLRAFTEADARRFWRLAHDTHAGPRAPFDYRLEHTLAVVKLARWLAPQVGADTEAVECAAWLHDCRKRLKDPLGKDHHAQEASDAVAEILSGTDFPMPKLPLVRVAIERHVGLRLSHRLEPVEAACLWDADKLSKLGAASLVHFVGISGAFQPMSTADVLSRGLAWLELARGIVASMNTAPARAEAEQRFGFLERHYLQLQREWADPLEGAPS